MKSLIKRTVSLFLLAIIVVSCNNLQTSIPDQTDPTKTITFTIATIPETQTPTPSFTSIPITLTPNRYSFIESTYSPNNQYIAEYYSQYDDPTGEKIIISKVGNAETWIISSQFSPSFLHPPPTLKIYKWSNNSKVLYFYYSKLPDGGDYAFWWDGFDLQSFDVETGEITRTIPSESKEMLSFVFSPDNRLLAYTRSKEHPHLIHIRDIATGEEKQVTIISSKQSLVRVGNIIWSPSGEKLLFQTEDTNHWTRTIYLDIVTMQMKIINKYRLTANQLDGWDNDNKIRFIGHPDVYTIDISDGVREILGTPTPKP